MVCLRKKKVILMKQKKFLIKKMYLYFFFTKKKKKSLKFNLNFKLKEKFIAKNKRTIGQTFFIKVLITSRNIFVGLFSFTNELKFLLTSGLIKKGGNLKKKSYNAVQILIRSFFLNRLYVNNSLNKSNLFILLLLGGGRFYKIFYNIFLGAKLN